MKAISYEDRQEIQAHLAEVWKILYANGLEDLEFQRTPNSKQKRRMCDLLIKFNKSHTMPMNGFTLNVSDHVGCWQGIKFEETPEEIAEIKRRRELHEKHYAILKKRADRKEARRKELEEEHFVAHWHKHYMTPHWESGYSSIWYFKQDEKGSRTYVGPQPNDFVYFLYNAAGPDGEALSKETRVKYMKKYKLDKLYDLETGARLESEFFKMREKAYDADTPDKFYKKDSKALDDDAPSVKKVDNAKLAKDYLRKKFDDGSWKDEALKLDFNKHEKAIDTYLIAVREFIKQQEEFNLHGLALYGINEERTKAHEALLEEYGLSNDNVARDVTKSFDFSGEYKFINGAMKTVFYSEYEASLRLAYALDVVVYKKYL